MRSMVQTRPELSPACPATNPVPSPGIWVRCRRSRGHTGDHEATVAAEVVVWPNG
jgi:hypothetical protein